jgi:polysaccharide export outer membrane protein
MPALLKYCSARPPVMKPERIAKFRQNLMGMWLVLLLVLPDAAAADEYRLAPGDVLRVMIMGDLELTVDVPIEIDGSAWFPLVGPVAASGETLRDVRSRTAEAYVSMSLGRPVASSDEMPQIIDHNQVYISVASYRPIYVTGDVRTAHEIPFRPGLTLQHLFALTGAGSPRDDSQTASLGEIEAAASALATEYAQIWRQKAFLSTDTPEDASRIFVVKGNAFDEIAAVERSILEETRAGLAAQKQYLRDEIARIEAHILVLSRQRDNENDGLAMDEQTLEDVQDLFSRNLVPASRLTDVRRATLVTASRVFQIDEALENARRQIATLEAEIPAVDNDARVRAWKDLGEAVARVQQRRTELEALLARGGGSQQTGLIPTKTNAIVTRGGVPLPSNETPPSFALMPGDIVEIRLTLPDSSIRSGNPKVDGQ